MAGLDRFDVAADAAGVRKGFGSRGLYHHVTHNNLALEQARAPLNSKSPSKS